MLDVGVVAADVVMADDALGLSLVMVIEVPPMVTPVEVSADFVGDAVEPQPATSSAVVPRMIVIFCPRMTGSLGRLCVVDGRNQRSSVLALAPAVDRYRQPDLFDHLGVGDGAV